MPLWIDLYMALFWPMLAAIVFSAFRWGGHLERRATLAFALACVAELLLILLAPNTRFSRILIGPAAVDIVLAIALTLLTVRYGKGWLYPMAAIQILTALSHFIKFLLPGISRMTYAILDGAGGYPQLLLLAIGIALHARNHRKGDHAAS